MIEEIFITSNGVVLIGDISLYPKNPLYPTTSYNDKQLTQLNCNDITLAILYQNIDVFYVLKLLNDLKTLIEQNISTLNAKNILNNYFFLKELIFTKTSKKKLLNYKVPILCAEEVYIDVIETYNAIVHKDLTVCDVTGYCFLKPRFNDRIFLKLIIRSDKDLKILSNYKIIERFNKLEMELNVENKDLQILKYKKNGKLPFNLEFNQDSINIQSDDTTFDFLQIVIPFSQVCNKLDIEISKGQIINNEDNNNITWKFKKMKIGTASLKFKNLSKLIKNGSISANFKISQTNKNILNIEKAICIDNQSINLWIKYDAFGNKVDFRL